MLGFLSNENLEVAVQNLDVKIGDIPSRRFTAATIKEMYRMIWEAVKDPDFQYMAGQIVRYCPWKDYKCFGQAVLDWIREKVMYVRDPIGIEKVQDPYVTLLLGTGDCDDFSIWLAAASGALGFDYRLKTVKADVDPVTGEIMDHWSHVYPVWQLPDGWYGSDAIVMEPGFAAPFGWEAEGFESKTWEKTSP